jgi:hypothetical protein
MRKPKELRKNQTLELWELFCASRAHQQVFAWDFRFISDMARKLGAGRKISTKQRNILDEKIAAGLPELPVASESEQKLSDALQIIERLDQFNWEHRVGSEMLVKYQRGWNVSEKQQKLVDSIIEKANNWNSMPAPTEELQARVALVRQLAKCYADNYWYSHAKAASYIRLVEGNKYSEKDVENSEYAVRGELKKWGRMLEKFAPGAYCKVPCRTIELAEAAGVSQWEKAVAIVISEPRVEKGGIMLDVLIAGQVVAFYSRNVTMR